jgi:PilZ domain-containing protein
MPQKVNENRSLNRLNFNLKVFELETGKRLGLTENIHSEGMMLMTVDPFEIEQVIQVAIKLPGEDENEKLMVTAESCWVEYDKKDQIYNVGFRFLYSTPEMKTYYKTMIDGLGM